MGCNKNFEFKKWYYGCCCEVELKVGTKLINKGNQALYIITHCINTVCGKVFYKTNLGIRCFTEQEIRETFYIVKE